MFSIISFRDGFEANALLTPYELLQYTRFDCFPGLGWDGAYNELEYTDKYEGRTEDCSNLI